MKTRKSLKVDHFCPKVPNIPTHTCVIIKLRFSVEHGAALNVYMGFFAHGMNHSFRENRYL